MIKKSLLITCLVMMLVLSFGMSSSKAIKPFKGLADIPEIKNKRPIHIALEAGGGAEIQLKYIKKFSEKTEYHLLFGSWILISDLSLILSLFLGFSKSS